MIDVENIIFDLLARELREEYDTIYVIGEYTREPAKFPCVSIIEINNTTYERARTTNHNEDFVEVTYEINVYSNKTSGKKTECKDIANFIDRKLYSLNFTRIMLQPIQNFYDGTIYRMTGRYRAVVSKDGIIYRS